MLVTFNCASLSILICGLVVLNDTCRIIKGCKGTTPVPYLYAPAGIAPLTSDDPSSPKTNVKHRRLTTGNPSMAIQHLQAGKIENQLPANSPASPDHWTQNKVQYLERWLEQTWQPTLAVVCTRYWQNIWNCHGLGKEKLWLAEQILHTSNQATELCWLLVKVLTELKPMTVPVNNCVFHYHLIFYDQINLNLKVLVINNNF